MAGGRFVLETVFTAKDYVSKSLNKQIKRTRKLNAIREKGMRTMARANKINAGLSKGFLAVGIAGAAASVGIWKVTKAGRDFDTQMSKVKANMGDNLTTTGFGDMRAKAAELGASTEFTSAEAASGMNELAKAGFTAEQSIGAVKAVLSGASAGEMEMSASAAILTSTMAGFGLRSKNTAINTLEAARVMDVLAVASTSTKSSIATLGESLKSVAPVAKQFGFSLEESVAMVAKMQDVGIDASESGNAIKTMLTKLTSTGNKETTAMLKDLGVSFIKLNGDMKTPDEIFKAAKKLQDGLKGNAAQAKAFADIVGMRGQKALTVLTGVFASGEGSDLINKLKDVTGASDAIAATKLDNLEGDIVKATSAFDGLSVILNDVLKGGFRPLIQEFTEWMSDPATKEGVVSFGAEIKSWLPKIKSIALGFVDVVVGVRELIGYAEPFSVFGGALVKGAAIMWTVTAAMRGWSAAVTASKIVMATHPILALMIAISIAILVVIDNWKEFRIAGNMALDAVLAPSVALANTLQRVLNLLGLVKKRKAFSYTTNTDGIMQEEEDKANIDARLAPHREKQRATQAKIAAANARYEASVKISVDANTPVEVTTKATGPGSLSVQNSGEQ